METLLGLACILPCLKAMQRLFKFTQGRDTFICDFIFALKFVEANLFTMYCDSEKKYNLQHFSLLVELIEHINDVVYLTWGKNLFLKLIMLLFLWEVSFTCYMLEIQSLGLRAW